MAALLGTTLGTGLAPGTGEMTTLPYLQSATHGIRLVGPDHPDVNLGAEDDPDLGPGIAERPLGTDHTGTIGRLPGTPAVLLLGTGPDAAHIPVLLFGAIVSQFGTERRRDQGLPFDAGQPLLLTTRAKGSLHTLSLPSLLYLHKTLHSPPTDCRHRMPC